MTNLEKIKKLVHHLQFMIDEGILNEEECGTVLEEIHSTMEILVDCNPEMEIDFAQDIKTLSNVLTK